MSASTFDYDIDRDVYVCDRCGEEIDGDHHADMIAHSHDHFAAETGTQ
jgi:hypothetical protein